MVANMIVCCKCRAMVRKKGDDAWFADAELAKVLEKDGVSHGYCGKCLSEEMDAIAEYNKNEED